MTFFSKVEEFIRHIFDDLSLKQKITYTLSISWMIFIGYLIYWNGMKGYQIDKSFKWNDWFWFGAVPALVPYLLYFIWKKKENKIHEVNPGDNLPDNKPTTDITEEIRKNG